MYLAIYVVFPWPEFAIHRALTGGYLSAFFIIFVYEKKNDRIHYGKTPLSFKNSMKLTAVTTFSGSSFFVLIRT
jgi:hypothetical protein